MNFFLTFFLGTIVDTVVKEEFENIIISASVFKKMKKNIEKIVATIDITTEKYSQIEELLSMESLCISLQQLMDECQVQASNSNSTNEKIQIKQPILQQKRKSNEMLSKSAQFPKNPSPNQIRPLQKLRKSGHSEFPKISSNVVTPVITPPSPDVPVQEKPILKRSLSVTERKGAKPSPPPRNKNGNTPTLTRNQTSPNTKPMPTQQAIKTTSFPEIKEMKPINEDKGRSLSVSKELPKPPSKTLSGGIEKRNLPPIPSPTTQIQPNEDPSSDKTSEPVSTVIILISISIKEFLGVKVFFLRK